MKKSVIIMPLLFIAVIGTIYSGYRYSKEKNSNLDVNQSAISSNDKSLQGDGANGTEKQENISENISTKERLKNYEASSEDLSLIEYLDYISLKNGQVTLAYYGDINTDEEWLKEITEEMDKVISGDFNSIDHSYPGYDSYQLYIEQTAQEVTGDNPDVIIYALPAVPDRIRDIGLTETEEYMGYVLDELVEEDTKVALLQNYPLPGEEDSVNSRALTYKDYLERMKSKSNEYDSLTIIPLHSEFESDIADESIENYFESETELNQAGKQKVISILDKLFKQKM
ncbi:hypothetical protein [Alkalibacterium gilvum]|uniref:GDSL-like Lipase/Acylhydrolase n=2 Tax=Alkalibacterium TaxID=99906 RepID=A0A1H6R4Z8_9LACT|nr:hypothetical protein [Alkalibacterium gilvum]SEI49526.1 hypothetical protein SAMN04488113_101143 [Alkalibacterium gilvum]HAJ70091.1 hypothetical protein [Alkalibacterium sp.]